MPATWANLVGGEGEKAGDYLEGKEGWDLMAEREWQSIDCQASLRRLSS